MNSKPQEARCDRCLFFVHGPHGDTLMAFDGDCNRHPRVVSKRVAEWCGEFAEIDSVYGMPSLGFTKFPTQK
jgi:hypothetical protein